MIGFKREKGRNWWGMNTEDMATFAELIWHLRNDPKPIGFNRRPMTKKQERIVEDIFDLINYPPDYAECLNKRNQ